MEQDSRATAAPAPDATGSFDPRRLLRPIVGFVIFLLLVAVLGFFGAPMLVRHYLPSIVGDFLGREVALDGVGFNPFTMTAELRGVRIMEPQGGENAGEAALSVERIVVNAQLSSLFYRAPVVSALTLEGPRVKIVRLA
ncbi:MAG: hypothetical protein LBR05_00355, partial [Azoarcus sp.]|nr:hypothetical protein [Azoarcus sp.]